ncbi:MAG: hypothetical protein IAI50_19435, partial [Candidatus Eremiobacteraeota bacterium]|nr:hypothetical protein [Candidatus Eremiobacteraeota bacterium]
MKRSLMVTKIARQRSARSRRILWSILASLGLNGLLLIVYPYLAYRPSELREPTTVVSVLQFERHRATPRPTMPPPHPRPQKRPAIVRTPVPVMPTPVARATPLRHPPVTANHPKPPRVARAPHTKPAARDLAGSPSMSFNHNEGVKLKMPMKYDTQDLGNGAASDVSKYVDFSKAKGAFVPQVWLVQLKTSYLSGPTLKDAVHDIVASLEPDGARMSASKPQRVCHGRYPAWFLSYAQPGQDLPGQYEN